LKHGEETWDFIGGDRLQRGKGSGWAKARPLKRESRKEVKLGVGVWYTEVIINSGVEQLTE